MAQWKFDKSHTSIEFVARHMMITNVRGSFGEFDGILDFDPAHPENAAVDVTIQAASLNTGVADRDNHLRSADFLDVANHPTITFRSTSVEAMDETRVRLNGDLTVRGVTKPVKLDVEYLGQTNSPFGDVRAGFEASTKINREDFGLTWNVALEAGGVLVGKEIKIELAVQAIRVAETAAV